MIPSLRLLAGVALLLLCTACGKELSYDTATSSGNTANVQGILKMKINGVQWVADVAAGASLMNGMINISGVAKDKKYFTITLTDSLPGTYILTDKTFHGAALTDSNQVNYDSFSTTSTDDSTLAGGTVTVSAIDKVRKTISGTFKFRMFRTADSASIRITEGVFEKLAYATALQPSSSIDTLQAKIDGVLWKAKNVFAATVAGKLVINATELNLSRTMGFQLPENIAAGTFDFTFFGDYMGTYAPDLSTSLIADPGKITIIERNAVTKRIRGNFNFRAVPLLGTGTEYSVTEGYFSIKMQ